MIYKNNILFFVAILSITLILDSCKTGKSSGPSYVGKWKYEVPDMPGGDNKGVLVISKVEDAYTCLAITDSGIEQPMDNFDIQDGKIIASYEAQGTLVEVGGSIEDNNITGIISAQGMSLDWSAVKVE